MSEPILLWKGHPLTDLSKEQLIFVLEYVVKSRELERQERIKERATMDELRRARP